MVACGFNTGPVAWIDDDLLVLNRREHRVSLYRWSPGGLVKEVYIAETGGLAGRLGSCTVSRDGRRLALTVNRWDVHIWQMDLSASGEGLNPRKLIASTFWDLGGEYSLDGENIAFTSTRSGAAEAWVASSDGSEQRQVTRCGDVGDVRWSSDGTRLVLNRGVDGNEDLYLANVKSGAANHLSYSSQQTWPLVP